MAELKLSRGSLILIPNHEVSILATDFLFDFGQLAEPSSSHYEVGAAPFAFLECHRAKKPLKIEKSSKTALKEAVGAE